MFISFTLKMLINKLQGLNLVKKEFYDNPYKLNLLFSSLKLPPVLEDNKLRFSIGFKNLDLNEQSLSYNEFFELRVFKHPLVLS